jgi:hypothetical protein
VEDGLKWVTREYVRVDRTACPWLIKKCINPNVEFIFVPTEEIEKIVKTQGAIPFDAPKVKLGHREGRCSFETIIEEYGLEDPALQELAKIVHAADTKDVEAATEGTGLSAIMVGIRINSDDDFQAIEKAKCVYDALYSYSSLKFIREKFRDEMEKMDRKQRYEFVKKKMKEGLP